jgi:hypothetical protein
MLKPRYFRLNRSNTIGFLEGPDMSVSNAVSIYLPPTPLREDTTNLLYKAIGADAVPPGLVDMVNGSETGATVFWSREKKILVLPPFPQAENCIIDGYDSAPLLSLLKRDFMLALVLVRLGAYAVGVAKSEKLIASKVGTGLVQGRHRQGGSSAARFQRRRENQADQFLDRVCGHVQDKFQPYVKRLDYLIYGGAHATILSLQKVCPFLRRFEDLTLPPLLDIQKPNQAELEAAVRSACSSKITEWREEMAEV